MNEAIKYKGYPFPLTDDGTQTTHLVGISGNKHITCLSAQQLQSMGFVKEFWVE